ncbi:hypothetical protein A2U01_0094405, partial [Trifolium medium]|nr:hypothetical protein [Trifolium medium]
HLPHRNPLYQKCTSTVTVSNLTVRVI